MQREDIKLVGFVTQLDTGDYNLVYIGEGDFANTMYSVERVNGVRFVAHWPKRGQLVVTLTRPLEFVRKELDEIFETLAKNKPIYYKKID